jgi:hypothetical protein
MKNNYLGILLICFLLATLNEPYRPWIDVNRNNSAKRSAGYFIIGYGPDIREFVSSG